MRAPNALEIAGIKASLETHSAEELLQALEYVGWQHLIDYLKDYQCKLKTQKHVSNYP